MENTTKRRLFIDMDGTLCVWKPAAEFEDLYSPRWFSRMVPHASLLEAVRKLLDNDRFEVFILSAVLSDSPYVRPEKDEWLDKHLPGIDRAHRIFVSTRVPKHLSVPGGINRSDILLDDYSKNLHEWSERGTAVKFMNGINGTNGTWDRLNGPVVHGDGTPEEILVEIESLACIL